MIFVTDARTLFVGIFLSCGEILNVDKIGLISLVVSFGLSSQGK